MASSRERDPLLAPSPRSPPPPPPPFPCPRKIIRTIQSPRDALLHGHLPKNRQLLAHLIRELRNSRDFPSTCLWTPPPFLRQGGEVVMAVLPFRGLNG